MFSCVSFGNVLNAPIPLPNIFSCSNFGNVLNAPIPLPNIFSCISYCNVLNNFTIDLIDELNINVKNKTIVNSASVISFFTKNSLIEFISDIFTVYQSMYEEGGINMYQPPGVISYRDPLFGTAIDTGRQVIVAIIGESAGKRQSIIDEKVIRSSTTDFDILSKEGVTEIIRITDTAPSQAGISDYRQGIDYILDANTVKWNQTVRLANPIQNEPIVEQMGGILSAATYYYAISALNANGETLLSNEKRAEITTNTGRVTLDWDLVEGASKYRIWRSEISGVYTGYYFETASGKVSSVIDDGTWTIVTKAPPAVNNAIKNPGPFANYYVTYNYNTVNYNVANTYYSTAAIYADHGKASPLGIAGKLVLARPPEGNGASSVILIAVKNHTQQDYIAALKPLENIDVDIIVSLLPIDNDLLAHCEWMSSAQNKKRRIMISGAKIGTKMGDSSTPNTIIYNAESLANKRAIYVSPASVFINVEQADNSYKLQEFDGTYLAAAVAGRIASLADRATPITRKEIYGINSLGVNPDTGFHYLETEKNVMANAGVCVCHQEKAGILVRHGMTTDRTYVESNEISVVLAEDYIIHSLEKACEIFIGNKLTNDLLLAIELTTKRTLNLMQKEMILRTYDSKSVHAEQDPVRPTWVLVSFKYAPIYPCNVIFLRYGFDLLS